jgi:hypothetical protein
MTYISFVFIYNKYNILLPKQHRDQNCQNGKHVLQPKIKNLDQLIFLQIFGFLLTFANAMD